MLFLTRVLSTFLLLCFLLFAMISSDTATLDKIVPQTFQLVEKLEIVATKRMR
jgi:hypothetical protein